MRENGDCESTGRWSGLIDLDLDSLKAMRSTTLAAVVECAGNGRVYYEPPKEGLQWQNGAVGNATWTGVSLREILEMQASSKRQPKFCSWAPTLVSSI